MADNFRTDPFKGPLMRVSYAFGLFKEREKVRDNGDKVYTFDCTLIVAKAESKPLQDAFVACMKGAWGEKAPEMFKGGLIRNPILSGDGKEARNKTTGEIHPGMGADVVFVRAGSNRRPAVVDPRLTPILKEEDLPSGSWGYPVLSAFSWSNPKSGHGVSFGIEAFQLVKKAAGGEVLGGGGGVDPKAYFEKIGGGGSTDDGPAASAADFFA
jgi:hypothetical protein